MTQKKLPLIYDTGLYMSKAGFAGESKPSITFHTVLGKLKSKFYNPYQDEVKYIGNEAFEKKTILDLMNPIDQEGKIKEDTKYWESIKQIWIHQRQKHLKVQLSDHPVLFSEPPNNHKADRQKLAQYIFQQAQCPALYICSETVLTMYASGKTTGLAIDIGEGVAHVVPVFQGYSIPHAIRINKVAGQQLNQEMKNMLLKTKSEVYKNCEVKARQIKQKLCYVALDYEAQMVKDPSFISKNYKLPDGQQIIISQQRFKCCEILFQPQLFLGNYQQGLHKTCYESILSCDIDLRKYLYREIALGGGTTMLKGFPERLNKQMKVIAPAAYTVFVNDSMGANSAWLGGSILSQLSTFEHMWISQEDYNENGPSFVHTKCF